MFDDRRHAGRRLGDALAPSYAGDDAVVLALPRGGVPVGYEIARRLGAALDVFVVRKIGVPGHEELAMGAIGSGGVIVVDPIVMRRLGIDEAEFEEVAARERRELERRERLFRDGRPPVPIAGRTAILVDDGLATGSSMRAAIAGVRQLGPARVVVAVPVAPASTCASLEPEVDDLICLVEAEPFFAVGVWFDDFTQTTDDEVRTLLAAAAAAPRVAAGDEHRPPA